MPDPRQKNRRPAQNPNDGKGADRYSSAVANATNAMEKHPQADPTNPVSVIAGYARLGESLRAAGNFREVAMEIAKIAELAETTVMEETSDWFDGHTVKRNMAELKKHAGQFSKIAEELDMMQQRASALYDDMGNVLGRYFEMAELAPISSAVNNPEDKGEEGFSPEDRAPEFDGPGGNPEDDEGREKHDAQDGVIGDASPTELPSPADPTAFPSDDDSEYDDDVVEGIVDRIMEKILPERGGPADSQRAHKALRTPESFARPHQGFTHDQAKEILKRTGTTTTEDAQKVMELASTTAQLQKKENELRQIVKSKSYSKIDGRLVDVRTANAIVQVLDAFKKPQSKAKFMKLPVSKMAEFAFSMMKREDTAPSLVPDRPGVGR